MKSVLLVIVISVALVAALIQTRPAPPEALETTAATRVEITRSRQDSIRPFTAISGLLQPARTATLQFEISGKLTDRLVEAGQVVEAGEVLLTIERGDLEDALRNAEAGLEQEEAAIERDRRLLAMSREEVALLEREVARQEKLERDALSSRSRADEVRRQLLTMTANVSRLQYSVNTADARLSRARIAVSMAERNLQRASLRAPFASRVNSVHVEVGDVVNPGQVAVEVVQVNELDLAIEAPYQVARSLQIGDRIECRVGRHTLQGQLIARAVDPDPSTLTYAMRIRIPADGVMPGQLAEARLPGELLDHAVLVPRTAILREEGGAFVFEVSEGLLVRKPVDIVIAHDGDYVIEGIDAGTRIVSRDVAALVDGQHVISRAD